MGAGCTNRQDYYRYNCRYAWRSRGNTWRRCSTYQAGQSIRKRPSGSPARRCCGNCRRNCYRRGDLMSREFDSIIIGAGQAGPPLAARLTQAGQRVALLERKLFGGTCVNTGCIPTKTMIASAHTAHVARRAADFGVCVGSVITVDMPAVMARKNQISGKSRSSVEANLREMERG